MPDITVGDVLWSLNIINPKIAEIAFLMLPVTLKAKGEQRVTTNNVLMVMAIPKEPERNTNSMKLNLSVASPISMISVN